MLHANKRQQRNYRVIIGGCFYFMKGSEIMIAESNTTYDGQFYKKGEEIHDLGSFVATRVNGNIRDYDGLSKDLDKLPKYDSLQTGSTATCIDTAQIFRYEATTKTWYEW